MLLYKLFKLKYISKNKIKRNTMYRWASFGDSNCKCEIYRNIVTNVDKPKIRTRPWDTTTRWVLLGPGPRVWSWFGWSSMPPRSPASWPTPYRGCPPRSGRYPLEVHISPLTPAFCTLGPLSYTGTRTCSRKSPPSRMYLRLRKMNKLLCRYPTLFSFLFPFIRGVSAERNLSLNICFVPRDVKNVRSAIRFDEGIPWKTIFSFASLSKERLLQLRQFVFCWNIL